jgi:cholesterol 7-dehydrogenase
MPFVPIEVASMATTFITESGTLALMILEGEVTIFGWQLAIAGVVLFVFFAISKSWRSKADAASKKSREAEKAAIARKRLTKLRASSHLFPAPYPNGWYCICRSEDVKPGVAVAASACNREFAVFRAQDNKVAVLHAFCPHLGTHLGHGGKVVKNSVVCPYHEWAFNADGKCVDIPYCPKAPTERTHTKSFHCRERIGLVFVWLHADDAAPTYELTLLDEIEEKKFELVNDVPCEDWKMHIQEPSQNAADPYHFNTTHSWVGAEDGKTSWLWIKHECTSHLGTHGGLDHEGKKMPDTVICVHERCTSMYLYGIIPLPSFLGTHYRSGAYFQGPQLSVFYIESEKLGSVRITFTFTPESPFVQRCIVRGYCSKGFPRWLAAWFAEMALATVNQDRKVWEHKLAVAPRNVVAGDGPFAQYGTWLRQFYSESSKTWGDISLEW